MRKILLPLTTLLLTITISYGDIQAPPASEYTATRKLGRALSNILYGLNEIPEQITRKTNKYGVTSGYSYGVVDGVRRGFSRIGYGFYELFTFTNPTFHGTFKPPYTKCGKDNRIEMNVDQGFAEFPPELGFESYYNYSRTQKF